MVRADDVHQALQDALPIDAGHMPAHVVTGKGRTGHRYLSAIVDARQAPDGGTDGRTDGRTNSNVGHVGTPLGKRHRTGPRTPRGPSHALEENGVPTGVRYGMHRAENPGNGRIPWTAAARRPVRNAPRVRTSASCRAARPSHALAWGPLRSRRGGCGGGSRSSRGSGYAPHPALG